jgi:hypothetical protein
LLPVTRSVPLRGLYSCKDTFMCTALTAGVNVTWLEQQTGVAYATIRRHYGRWFGSEGESQTAKIAASKGTLSLPLSPTIRSREIPLTNQRVRSARRGT